MRLLGLTDLSNSLVHNGLRHSQYVKVRRLFIYQILWKKLLSSALKKILYSKNNLVFTKLCNFLNFYSHLSITFRCVVSRTCNSYTILPHQAK